MKPLLKSLRYPQTIFRISAYGGLIILFCFSLYGNEEGSAHAESEKDFKIERDPFSYTEHMKSLKFDPHDVTIDQGVVMELIPDLQLLAIARGKDGTTMAILNIKNQAKYVVKTGDLIPMTRKLLNTFIKIKEISNEGIVAQVGDLGTDIYVK